MVSRLDSSPSGAGMDRPITRQPAWRRYGIYVISGLLLVGISLWELVGSDRGTYRVQEDKLTVGTVTRASFEDFISVRGLVAPFTTRYVTAEQGGTVRQVLVEDGAMVKAGQPLVVLSNIALQLQVASQEASAASQINALEDTKLQLEDARFKYEHDLLDIEHQISKLKGDLTRDKILLDGNAIAPAVFKQEEEEYAYEVALREATLATRDTQRTLRAKQLQELAETLARLNGTVASAEASLDALTIRSGTDGQLTALDAEVGQSKVQGAVLGQVNSLDRFKITAQVDEFYLNRVALGQVARFAIDGHNYNATIAKVYPQIATGTFKVDLQFADSIPVAMHTGQAVDLRLELGGATQALTLTNGPYYQDTGGRWVFVIAPNGQYAVRRNVRLGRRNPEFVEILEGLQAGERVIISSYEAYQKIDRVVIEKSR